MPRLVHIASLLLALALVGCGFQPLYGQRFGQEGSVAHLAAIKVAPIKDRGGQMLRNDLLDKLTPKGVPDSPLYQLEVGVNETRSDLVMLRDATSTFAKVRFDVSYSLTDLRSGTVLTKGRTQSVITFNLVESDFANLSAENDARRRAAEEISEDIRLRLGLYFSRQTRRN